MKSIKKVLALALALAMVVTAVPVTNAEAATNYLPTKKTYYVGKTYTLKLTTPSSWKSVKTTWTKSNSDGKVTLSSKKAKTVKVKAVQAGTATVKAKVTYKKNGKAQKAKTYKCTVTVKDPSLDVKTTPSEVVVGTETDLGVTVKPASSKVTYYTTDAEVAEVVDGKLNAKKVGTAGITIKTDLGLVKTFLVTVTGKNTVKSVEVLNGAQLKVTFNEAVYNTAAVAAAFTLKKDGVSVAFTGAFDDSKTVCTLTTSTAMSGKYTVALAANTAQNNVGDYFDAFEGTVEVSDTVAPTIVSTSYNDECDTLTITFSEPMQGTGTVVAARADGKALTDGVSVSKNGTSAYDVKLTKAGAAFADGNTNINLTLTGIADLSGNVPGDGTAVTLTANYDVATVANASIVSVTRTGLAELTVQFDKKIKTAGTITVGGTTQSGTVASDKTKVTYPLDATQQALTGTQLVTVTGYQAYKADSAASAVIKSADFTYTAIAAPVITKLEYVAATTSTPAYFLATYDKDVVITDLATGNTTVTSKLTDGTVSTNQSVAISTNVKNTTDLTATKDTASKITLATMPAANGTYTITLPAGIAKNTDGVANAETTLVVTITAFTATVSTTPLPAPTSVAQSASATNTVEVTFGKKVDITSAETAGNYSIAGATVTKAEVTANAANNAVVKLTVSVPATGDYAITVKGVKGYDGSYAAMDTYSVIKTLNDTVVPTLTSAAITVAGDGNTTDAQIKITFSENVDLAANTDDALEIVVGTTTYKLTNTSAISSANTGVFTIKTSAGATITAAETLAIVNGGKVQVKANGTAITDSTGVNAVANTISVSAN